MSKSNFSRVLSVLLLTIVAVMIGQGRAFAQVGTFTVTNSDSTFTITRTTNTGATEKVMYRTVSLSAIAGTHFTATSGELTFDADHNTRTVTVTESGSAANAYKYQTASSRTYRFEVTDLGGGYLAHCNRSITSGLTQFSGAKVSSSISNLVTMGSSGNFSSGMSSGKYLDVSGTLPTVESSGVLKGYVLIDDEYDYAQKPATVSTSSLISSTGATAAYLNSLGYKIYATVCFTAQERDDGYQYIQILSGTSSSSYDGADPEKGVNDPSNSLYKVCYELSDGSDQGQGKAYFPHRGTGTGEFSLSDGKLWAQKYKSGTSGNGTGCIILAPTVTNITTRFDAGGKNDDTWGYKDFFVRMALCDATAPAISGDPVVSPGPYGAGTTVYISVPFSEIVTVTGTPYIHTDWGDYNYFSGSGSNVLTFSGTIPNTFGATLNTRELVGTITDLAGNVLSGTSCYKAYGITVALPWGGSGTEADPYVITRASQLDYMAVRVNANNGADDFSGKYFVLAADIAYSYQYAWDNLDDGKAITENNYTAIGGYGRPFRGHFDGQGHTVSGIRIKKVYSEDGDYSGSQGLFGYLGSGGTVENVIVRDAMIDAYVNVGGIVGYNSGTVSNCIAYHVRVFQRSNMANVTTGRGPITGYNGGTVTRCHYRDCAADQLRGGGSMHIYRYDNVFALTTATGVSATPVTGESAVIDATTYYTEGSTFTLAYSGTLQTGSVLGGYSATAGTVSGSTFTMPAADVTVSATLTDLWDITSGKDGTTAEKAYTITSTAGLDLLATLVNGGNNFDGKYFKLDADITYTHTTNWNDATSTENNYTAIGGYVDGNWRDFCGTFDGQGHTVRGIRIYKGGTTTADDSQGLFGSTIGATIRNVILADARITGRQYVGGIAGYIIANAGTGGIVENCRVGSDVTIHAVVDYAFNHGGVVGDCNGGTISGCVTSATLTVANGLTSITYYGGIVGNLGGNMSDCLSIDASVPDVDMNGAIAGEVATNRTLTNNYYYNCTVGGATTNVGIGAEEGNTTPHDRDGARSVHSLTLPDGVTDTGESVTIGTDIYYISNTTVTLNAPTGYVISAASYSDGADHNITGNTFTMPAADVTVSATLTDVWGIASGKDGTTAEKAYTITSTAGLDLLATLVNGGNNFDGKYFKLGADITYTNTTDWNDATSTENNFTAIGVYVDGNWRYFGGTFDGQNHTVRGIRIYKGGTTNADGYQGLFGRTIGATIRNVILADARITGKQNVGGIAGYTESAETGGIVENCRVGSDVTIHAVVDYASYHGGVVGDCNGTISGCVSSATLTVANDLTGINSYGGIVGGINNIGSTIENCLALGAHVPALVKYYGIITGENESNGTSTGILTANYYRGCTVGTNENAVNVGVGTNNGSTDKDGARCVHSLTCGSGVTATPGTVESVNISGVTYYASGSTFTLAYTGTPATGHRFTGFNATAGTVSGDPTNGYTFAMAAADAIVNARIEEVAYIITYDLDGGELSGEYRTGYSVTTPTFALPTPTRTGYTFAGWTGTDLAEPTLTVIVSQGSTGDRSYTAHWTAIDYTVYPYGGWDGWAFEHGTVTPDKIMGVHYGDVVTLAVTQEVGYLLKTLTVMNRTTGETTDITADENGRYAFTMPASNVDVYAEFAEAHTVVIDVNIEHGTVTASPTVAYEGQAVTLTVTPDPGYELVWLKYGDYEWNPDWDPLRLSFEMSEATYFLVEAEFRMTWARLNNAMQNGGTFTLTNNVTAADGDGPLSVPEGKTVTLDLNGHTLNRNLTAATASGSVIEVNGTLTLNDGSASGTGTITGGNSTYSAGGVDVDGGTFTMNGGTISNNTAGSGGGVHLYSGTFTMNGGRISNNDANFGGGVYVNLSSTFTMNGGTISGNIAYYYGGVAVDGTFNVSGNPVITGNTKMNGNANNVYLKNGKVITVTGALTNAAHISVTTQTAPTPSDPVTFTSGLSGNGTVANFTSDNGSNIALINGEAALLATYTMTFACGNGSGTMAPIYVEANTYYTIPDCGFTAPAGMMFVSWVGSNGWTLKPGEEMYMSGDYTLTAVFQTYRTVTITGDGAGDVETEWTWDDASYNSFYGRGTGSGIRFPEGASLDFHGLPLFISSTPALNFDESGMSYSLNNVTTDVSISLMAGYAINLNGSGYESGLHAYARSVADDRYIVTSAPAGAVVYIIGTMDGGAGAVQSCTATGHTSGTSYDVSVEDFGWAALGFGFTMPDEAVDANLVIGNPYGVYIDPDIEHGSVSKPGNSILVGTYAEGFYFAGDEVTLTVTPDLGYELATLTVTYQDYYETHTVTTTQGIGANANQYTFTMPNERVDVNATFTWINPMELRDNADNTALIAAANGMTGLNVTIQGRTFKGGKKQTICLPFDPSHLLTLGTVWAFTGISEGKIVMTEQTGTLAANTPYIFQATNDASNVEFSNVTIVNSDDPKIVNNEVGFTFRGTYTQKTWEADDAAVTGGHLYGFMMQDNDGQVEGQFVKARRKTILRPFSCYLEYNGDLSDTNPSSHAAARSATRGTTGETPDVIDIVWVSANGTVTGISRLDTRTGEITDSDDWYLMDGRKLNGKPTVKGLYINNGKVVIIK